MTATAPHPSEELERIVPLPARSDATTFEEVLGTTDHKVLGRLYIAAAIGFGILGVVAGILATLERVTLTDYALFDEAVAFQIFSIHRLAVLYLLVIPLTIGVATVVVPLQVGAQTLVFPRFAAVGFWTWLIGGVILVLAYTVDVGPGGTEPQSRELWVVSIGLIAVGLLVAAVVLAATVLAARAPGMGLADTPFFSWSVLVASLIWALSLASLLATLVIGFLTTTYGPSLLGSSTLGGAEETWVLIGWFAERPQVLSLLIVGLGVTGDVVGAIAGVAPRARGVLLTAIGAFGFLTLGSWAQTALYPSLADDAPALLISFVIGLPLLVLIGGWGDTLRRGTPSFAAPLVGLLAFVVLAAGAVISGELLTIRQLELFGTSAISGQFGFAVAGALAAAFAALCWWAPKIWGRRIGTGLAQGSAFLVLLGGLLVGLPELISGFLDQPEPASLADLADTVVLAADGLDSGVEVLNAVAVGGWMLLALGLLTVTLGLARSAAESDDEPLDDDPWGGGQTLEWSVSSPPPADNFDQIPTVDGPTPLLVGEETQ